MKRSTRNWLTGCGVTVVVAAVAVGATLAVVGVFVRGIVRDFEKADDVLGEVAAEYGNVEEYRVDPRGSVDPRRVEAFLSVRRASADVRVEAERALAALSDGATHGALGRLGAALVLPRRLASFLTGRNAALVENEMGLGEFYYLYAVVYYSWLGKDPADGPPFRMVSEDGYLFETVGEVEEAKVRRERDELTRRSLHRTLLPVLRRQLTELDVEVTSEAWRESLDREIRSLEADPLRLPWQDGLPEALESSLAPYRDELEAGYSELCNPLEVAAARRDEP